MQAAAIITLCVGASILYGILHDQITARLCVEYFTVGHPPIFPTDSPTLLALGWGVIATWWVGLMLGVPLAIAARAGHRPRRDVRSLVRPIARLLLVMAACALAAGILGFLLAKSGVLILAERFAARTPKDHHARLLAAGAAHLASYGVGLLGGLVVIARVWRSRVHGEADAWDRKIEEDVAAGRLDPLADQADRDLDEGRCTDLPR